MKKLIIPAILICFLIAGYLAVFDFHKKTPIATINGHKFALEIASNEKDREKGLSGRKKLCENCGMFFSFKEKGVYNFWMKDMMFNLDIIWISDGVIVEIAKNVPSNSQEIKVPNKLSDGVLEINAGLSDRYGFSQGDEIIVSY